MTLDGRSLLTDGAIRGVTMQYYVILGLVPGLVGWFTYLHRMYAALNREYRCRDEDRSRDAVSRQWLLSWTKKAFVLGVASVMVEVLAVTIGVVAQPGPHHMPAFGELFLLLVLIGGAGVVGGLSLGAIAQRQIGNYWKALESARAHDSRGSRRS